MARLEKIIKDNVVYIFGETDRLKKLSRWLDSKDLFTDMTLGGTVNTEYSCLILDDCYESSILVETGCFEKLSDIIRGYVTETYYKIKETNVLKDRKAIYSEGRNDTVGLIESQSENLGKLFDLYFEAFSLVCKNELRTIEKVFDKIHELLNAIKISYVSDKLAYDDFS